MKGSLPLGIVLLGTEPDRGECLEDGLPGFSSILLNSKFQLRAVYDPEPLIERYEHLRTSSALKHDDYSFVRYSCEFSGKLRVIGTCHTTTRTSHLIDESFRKTPQTKSHRHIISPSY